MLSDLLGGDCGMESIRLAFMQYFKLCSAKG